MPGWLRAKGRFPLRRTIEYLSKGKQLKPAIRTFVLNYRTSGKEDSGVRNFAFFNLPQLVYANPNVQFLVYKNREPNGKIQIYMEGSEKLEFDIDNMKRPEIVDTILKVAQKFDSQIEADKTDWLVNPWNKKYKINTANFGLTIFGQKKCMCMLPGQLPCSKFRKSWPKFAQTHAKKINAISKGIKYTTNLCEGVLSIDID